MQSDTSREDLDDLGVRRELIAELYGIRIEPQSSDSTGSGSESIG
jgi:hypothetical protein